MDAVCPAPGPDDPMVQSLLGVVDCNVRALVHTGYGAIFQPGAAIAGVLTAILTIYVATPSSSVSSSSWLRNGTLIRRWSTRCCSMDLSSWLG
jgi:hypothetical protein